MHFDKAFVSVHRESLWSIMRSYGIPWKMLRVIKDVCEGFEWAVVDRMGPLQLGSHDHNFPKNLLLRSTKENAS